MPEVRGKSCEYYAGQIALLTAGVDARRAEADAETAAFFAASVAMSLVVPFSGLATIPAEAEARRDTVQASSDLWSYRVAYEARECLPALAQGESK